MVSLTRRRSHKPHGGDPCDLPGCDQVPLDRRRYPEDLSERRDRYPLDGNTPPIHSIAFGQPLRWLSLGWHDLWRAPAALLHGLLVTAVGLIIMAVTWEQAWLSFTALSGFLLAGPILAVGVNRLAQRLEHDERIHLSLGLDLRGETWIPVLLFAAILAIIFAIWSTFVWLWIGVITVGDAAILGTLPEMLGAMLGTTAGLISLLGTVVAGAVLALVVFTLSMVTLPAMLDRRIGLIDAMAISLNAFFHNRVPALFWAALITVLFGISVLTGLLALVVIFPWLGFAMWHAYRDLVEHPEAESREGSAG